RRLAERGGRPPGPRPIRGGRPPGGRRPEPPPHPLEAPTSPLPASAPAQPPVAQTPLARPPELPPSMPAPPLGRGASALGELSLDAPRVGTDDDPTAPVDRPWWVSPPVVILGILLCGPFGAFVVAAMWVRGGYPRRARITAAAVWAGLMILLSA